MTSAGDWTRGRSGQNADNVSEVREPGGRRKKFAGYLRAANEMRQTYQLSYKDSWASRGGQGDSADDIPGAFPGSITASSGDNQLVLFPSYARRHIKQKPTSVPGTIQESSGSGRDVRDTSGSGDAEFWRQEWDKYEDDNATVDVDVRGWLFAPHRGPMTRKNRILIGLARQLSGIPAPRKSPSASASTSRSSSPSRFADKLAAHTAKHEEEQAAREAELIVRRGEAAATVAGEGGYSENPADRRYDSSDSNTPNQSRDPSPRGRLRMHRSGIVEIKPVYKQTSWNNPAQLTQAELIEANTQMMRRLQPFLANPLANTSISAFFYNDRDSRQKTVDTNASGHFTIRAALDFVPTHVRVLASDKLSVTEEVLITEPHGVSVISDIDDTIKHSAITMGARETFRNVFIRDVRELSINGVKEWYQSLADLGCMFHYVSNSPWQMYPLLTSFFASAGLPQGSFHLKQYSGLLQGLFEPVAERKKGTFEKILTDFPERRFLLIGDSGEADLEVYVDFVSENPGRVLGVFIRDVTTTVKPGFFDPALGPLGERSYRPAAYESDHKRGRPSNSEEADIDFKEAVARSLKDTGSSAANNKGRSTKSADAEGSRPALPPRRPTAPAAIEEDLIDFESDDDLALAKANTQRQSPQSNRRLQPPPRPSKPRSLSGQSLPGDTYTAKTPPSLPRKPSTSIRLATSPDGAVADTRSPKFEGGGLSDRPQRPDPPAQRMSYRTSARQKIDSAYAKMPSPTTLVFGTKSSSHSRESSMDNGPRRTAARSQPRTKPPVPPRKPPTYTGSAAQSISNFYNSATRSLSAENVGLTYGDGEGKGTTTTNSNAHYDVPLNKKELDWKKRWAAAKQMLDREGVMLRSWRDGDDVRTHAVRLVERALREEHNGKDRRQ